MRALVHRALPEAVRQLRETQDLLKTSAEAILTLLEHRDHRLEGREPNSRPPVTAQEARTLTTSLLEKMSFQDLAGQRLAKVEDFLKTLEEIVRPDTLAAPPRAWRPKPSSYDKKTEVSEKKPFRARRVNPPGPGEKTLKGPQATGHGLNQSEIEGLMADLQKGPAAHPGRSRRDEKQLKFPRPKPETKGRWTEKRRGLPKPGKK